MDIKIYRVDDGTTYIGTDGKEHESYTYWLVCGPLKQPITINTFKGKYPNLIRFFPVEKVNKEQFNQI